MLLVPAGVVALATSARAARCTSTEACLQQIEAAQRGTASIQARFTQTKNMSLLQQPLVATGRFSFKRPDRVRWQIEQPDPATVIINGGQLIVPGLPEEERKALSTVPVATALAQFSALFAGDVSAMHESFDVTAENRDAGIDVRLVPRQQSMHGMFTRIDLSFAAPDLTLRMIRLENQLGDRVEVVFEDVVVNAALADSLFAVPTVVPTP
jgi:outer membrane lipoprotein-sorting protein